jgi:hypothetical protein
VDGYAAAKSVHAEGYSLDGQEWDLSWKVSPTPSFSDRARQDRRTADDRQVACSRLAWHPRKLIRQHLESMGFCSRSSSAGVSASREREPFWRLRCEVYGGRCSNLLRLTPRHAERAVRAGLELMPAVIDGLRQDLSPLRSSGRLSLTPIQVERHTIPALATGQFDLIEFVRHEYTKLDAYSGGVGRQPSRPTTASGSLVQFS